MKLSVIIFILFFYVYVIANLETDDLVQIYGLTSNSTKAQKMNNQIGTIIGQQSGRYKVKLLSDASIEAALKTQNLKRIGRIIIHPHHEHPQFGKSPQQIWETRHFIMNNPGIIYGEEEPEETINKYRDSANIFENVFGFENMNAFQLSFLIAEGKIIKKSVHLVIFSVFMGNPLLIFDTVKTQYPNNTHLLQTIMAYHRLYLKCSSHSYARTFRKTLDDRQMPRLADPPLGDVLLTIFTKMKQEFGWQQSNWMELLKDIIEHLKKLLREDYERFEYRIVRFDKFLERLNTIHFLSQNNADNVDNLSTCNALRDYLSAKNIIDKYQQDSTKDIHIKIGADHLQTLPRFLSNFLTCLGNHYIPYVWEIIKRDNMKI